jgi:steroid delta-isomerase-like uncharacterized protein
MADIKGLTREFYEGINRGDLSVTDTLIADNFVDHEEFPGIPHDKAGVRQFFEMARSAFPDLRFNLDDVMAENDKVTVRFTITGTQRGEFLGVPASNKQVNAHGIDILRVQDDKAVEHWGVTDVASIMTQIGAMQPPGQP